MKISPHTFKLSPFRKENISDQVTLVVRERHQLPMTAIRLVIKGGAAMDPDGAEGLRRITAKMLQRGAGKYSAAAFSEAVENRGGSLFVQTGYDFVAIQGEFRSQDADYALNLLALMLREPRLSGRELNYIKKKTLSEILSLYDEPSQYSSMIHRKNLFPGHPYGRPVEGYAHTVTSISRDDVVKEYTNRLRRSKIFITVVGDVVTEDIVRAASAAFRGLTTKFSGANGLPVPSAGKKRTVFVVNREDQTQAHIRIGNIGIARNDPVYYHLMVANTIFGGSFTSRLMSRIRVKEGLTYGIGSSVSARLYPGSVTIATFTKTGTAARVVELIYNEIHKVHTGVITMRELNSAKRYMIGLYPLLLETNSRMAQYLSDIFFYALPPQTIEEYPGKIAEVTAEDARDAARNYYKSEKSTVTILGNAREIAPMMDGVGTVIVKDSREYIVPDGHEKYE